MSGLRKRIEQLVKDYEAAEKLGSKPSLVDLSIVLNHLRGMLVIPDAPVKVFVAVGTEDGKVVPQVISTAPVAVVVLVEYWNAGGVGLVEKDDITVVKQKAEFQQSVFDCLAPSLQNGSISPAMLEQLSQCLNQ